MIGKLIKRFVFAYLHLIKDLFELVFGIKIFKIFYSMVVAIIRFVKFAFIAFHVVLLIYYFMYPQHVYKQLVFHKNEANNYFSYFLETSATQQLCYQWKLYKSAMIEKEEALTILESKVKKEERQLELFVQQSLKQINQDKDGQQGSDQNQNNNKKQESDEITLNVLQYQNNIKKYKSDYDEYKSKLMSFTDQKKREMMWQSWIEMDLICNLHGNQNNGELPQKRTTETSSIIFELQILNLSSNPSSLKVIPLNVLLIDKFNQKIPMKKDIVIQQEQSTRKSYWEKVLKAVLSKCFALLGIEIEDDVFELRQEIEALSKGQGYGNDITGILISLENPNNQFLVQQARIEIIPVLKGLKYFIFHYFYLTFVGLFSAIIIYLYLFTGIISFCCNLRNNKQKDD